MSEGAKGKGSFYRAGVTEAPWNLDVFAFLNYMFTW